MLNAATHHSTDHAPDASPSSVRLQFTCVGVSKFAPATTEARQAVQQLLSAHADEIGLAVVNVEQRQGVYRCDTRLFGRGLEHVGGYAEHANAADAILQSARRALRALNGSQLHNPWTSSPPSSQRGAIRGK